MRRAFLRAQEIPALVIGVARGKPVAMRRVLGARRAGRVGVALALLGVLLAVPAHAVGWLAAAQLAIGLPAAALSRPPLAWLEYQRLSFWLVGSALISAAPFRLGGEAVALPAVALFWLAAHLWLVHRLRRGLGSA